VSPRLLPAVTLAGIVLAAAAVWGTLGQRLHVPTVFGDELIHWDASRSLAAGDGLSVRDGGYGFGPLYPMLLAPVHLAASTDLGAYQWARLLDAVVFALAAVPGYFLARRLLPPGWSLACAALTVAIPSALYTGFVMTESVAYTTCVLAFLACLRCLERPSVAAQLLALAAVGLAATARFQLAALGLALLVGVGGRAFLTPRAGRRELRGYWPLLAVLGVAAVALGLRAALGNPLAGYGDLWRSYDLVEVARWTWRGFAGLGLYLALVPVVVAPATIAALVRAGREGDRPAAAFVSLFLSTNAVLLLLVGAFTSTEFGVGFLHDRYLFYVVPLWIVATAVWAERRLPIGPVGIALGALLVLVPLVTLPTYLLNADGGRRFDAVASALPSEVAVRAGLAEPQRWWLIVAGIAAVLAVVALGWAPRWLVFVPVGAVFALNAGFAWDSRIDAARNTTFAPMNADTVSWVDRAVPPRTKVATLAGGVPVETRDALRLTEFFNASIGTAYDLGGGYAPTLASTAVRAVGGGVLLTDSGPVHAAWVVAPKDLDLVGDVVAEGTVEGLRLWRVHGPLQLAEPAG
jgi:hypothetical protein